MPGPSRLSQAFRACELRVDGVELIQQDKERQTPVQERAAQLVSRMTLAEKVSQMRFDAPPCDG
jgi:hypothetical protein